MKISPILLFLGILLLSGPPANAAPLPLVGHEETWLYHKGTNAPPTDWKTAGDAELDPGSWTAGPGGFGYAGGSEDDKCLTLLPDMRGLYTTLYYRKSFTLSESVGADLYLLLDMDWDDGFIAWLDGEYLGSRMVPGAPTEPAHTDVAGGNHESSAGNSSPQPVETLNLGLVGARLEAGEHVLAIMGLNVTSGSSDFIQVADLSADEILVPPPGTELSGTIGVDTTLYASNRVYTMVGSVTVAPGITLTIEPGLEIQCRAGTSLTVAAGGRLLAEGTAEDRITFTRAPGASTWGGITIRGNADSPESRMAFVHVEHNGSTAIHGVDATLSLDSLTFGTAARQFVSLDRCSFVVRHCHFPRATASFEPVHGTGGIKSGGRGLFLRNYFGSITGYNDTIDFSGSQRPGPIVQFVGNVFAGTGDDHLDIDNNDAWVEGNIFLHAHKNGSPDTSSAISGGDDTGNPSEVTIIGNIIYDCDQAVLAKQGNVFVMLNNTIVHQTHVGGLDTTGAVVCTQDNNASEGAAVYLEGNIIQDAESLTRDVVDALVTFSHNQMWLPWAGPGGGNITNDPQLVYVPSPAETTFATWSEAQVLWDWFQLQPGSPAKGAGPEGRDIGATTPGLQVSGAPDGETSETNALLTVSIVRTGSGITAAGWPAGAGYTHYKWRLDGGPWSPETATGDPIELTGLADGSHTVEVTGKTDAGWYRDDPLYDAAAYTTSSGSWTVLADADEDGMPDSWEAAHGLDSGRDDAEEDHDHDGVKNLDEWVAGTDPDDPASYLVSELTHVPSSYPRFFFAAVSNRQYDLEYRSSLLAGDWGSLTTFPAASTNRLISWGIGPGAGTDPDQGYLRLRVER